MENQNFEKMKKTPGAAIILHMCNIDDIHMMYGSWDMEHDRQNFLLFWAIFCPFTPLKLRKVKILRQWKKLQKIILQKCTTNHDHMPYCSWDMACDGCNFYFHFALFFALLPTLTPPPPINPKSQKILKIKKTPVDITILHMCTKNYEHMMYGSWEMLHNRQMNRQMDGKSDI